MKSVYEIVDKPSANYEDGSNIKVGAQTAMTKHRKMWTDPSRRRKDGKVLKDYVDSISYGMQAEALYASMLESIIELAMSAKGKEKATFENEIENAKEETNKRIELTTSRMLKVAKQYELDKKRDIESEKVKTVNINDNVINGDSLKVLNDLDDGVIDIVITDPPYGINYKSNFSIFDNTITKRGLSKDNNEAFKLLDKTCEILQRKTSENAHLYFFCSWTVFSKFESIIGKYFTIKTPLVWNKLSFATGDIYNDWANQTEIILYCVKGKKGFNKRKGNVLSVTRMHTSKMVHPTQKPVELIKHILDASA